MFCYLHGCKSLRWLLSVRSVRPSQHGRPDEEDKGTTEPVQHQPETVRGGRACLVPGVSLRPAGQAQAVAHVDPEGQGALHQDEDLPGGRDRRAQAGGQPVQDSAGQADEDWKLQSHGSVLLHYTSMQMISQNISFISNCISIDLMITA